MNTDPAPVTVSRRPSGSLKLTTFSDDGLTFEALQSSLTQRVSVPGRYLHIKGPLEHKRPQRAMYDLHSGLICDWPDNRNERRRSRFNTAAHRLIAEAGRLAKESAAACGHTVPDRLDLHWSADLEDEVCPDCCQECD